MEQHDDFLQGNFNKDYFSIEMAGQIKKGIITPEYAALLAGIIDQSVRDYLAYKNPKNVNKKSTREHGQDAESWLFFETRDNLKEKYQFEDDKAYRITCFTTFEHICEILNWDPLYIRNLLNKMVENGKFYKKGRRRESVFYSSEEFNLDS